LIHWIYDTEFIAVARQKEYQSGWELLEDLCIYFDENRDFYRKSFRIDGQNSFSDYFRNIVAVILSADGEETFRTEDFFDFYVDFFSDAFVCAIKRWLLEKEYLPAADFAQRLKLCLIGMSDKIIQKHSSEDTQQHPNPQNTVF
jgi:hypothetical protein